MEVQCVTCQFSIQKSKQLFKVSPIDFAAMPQPVRILKQTCKDV